MRERKTKDQDAKAGAFSFPDVVIVLFLLLDDNLYDFRHRLRQTEMKKKKKNTEDQGASQLRLSQKAQRVALFTSDVDFDARLFSLTPSGSRNSRAITRQIRLDIALEQCFPCPSQPV